MPTNGRTTHLNRRDLLRASAAGAALSALSTMAPGLVRSAHAAPLTNHKRLVVLFLQGGNDGLNTVVPVTNNAYYSRRPTLSLDAADCLSLNGTTDYMMHPALANLRSMFNNEGTVAIINKVGYPQPNGSHFKSEDIWNEGVRNSYNALPITKSGWIARYSDTYAPTSTAAVSIGPTRPSSFDGSQASLLNVENLTFFQLEGDRADANRTAQTDELVQAILDQHDGAALENLVRDALNTGRSFADSVQAARTAYETTTYASQYPGFTPGKWLKIAANLIHGGFDTRIFYCEQAGYDTHANQGALAGRHSNLLQGLDDSIATFVADLKSQNVWDDTVLLLVSEFGRRNFENASDGTDHGSGNVAFALGGGVQGGFYGPDLTEQDVSGNNSLPYEIDFRDIYKRVLSVHLGVDPAPVFPEAQDKNNTIAFI